MTAISNITRTSTSTDIAMHTNANKAPEAPFYDGMVARQEDTFEARVPYAHIRPRKRTPFITLTGLSWLMMIAIGLLALFTVRN